MAKWCNEGETSVGDVYLKNATQVLKYLGLYLNTTEPAEDATLTGITEPTWTGYVRIQLAEADWAEQATKGEFLHTQKTFSHGGGSGVQVYGYFICTVASGSSGKLLAVEHFSDGPYQVNPNWSVKVTPKVTIS